MPVPEIVPEEVVKNPAPVLGFLSCSVGVLAPGANAIAPPVLAVPVAEKIAVPDALAIVISFGTVHIWPALLNVSSAPGVIEIPAVPSGLTVVPTAET